MKHVVRGGLTPFQFGGLRISDFGPQPAASASVAVIDIPAGASHQEARSGKSDKYYICQKGPVMFTVDGQSVSLDTGDLLVVFKGEWFSYANRTNTATQLLLIHVPPFDLATEEFRS